MEIHVITIFPFFFEGFLKTSIVKIAQEKELVKINLHNLRQYTEDRHQKVDDAPYGGGPGMVLKAEPLFRAVEDIMGEKDEDTSLILLSPQGETFQQKRAVKLAEKRRLIFLCGRYEGFDERVRLGLPVEEISIGDYVLTGGEVPAMTIMDAVIRLLPGALGDEESAHWESFTENLLDFPQYTRPPEFRGMKVPEVLLSGNHQKIAQWRKEQAIEKTKKQRRDLLEE